MLRRSRVTAILIMMLIMLMTQAVPIEVESASDKPQTLMIDSTDNAISFVVNVPLDEIAIEEKQVNKNRFTEVYISGYSSTSEVGAPQLPLITEVLGVPFESDVKVTVTPGREKRRKLNAPVIPVATETVEWDSVPLATWELNNASVDYSISADPKYYENDGLYPNSLGGISNDAFMRSQRLVSISLYPVRYDAAANELVMVETLTVTVEFSGSTIDDQKTIKSEPLAYEQVFQNTLLNYEQAKKWRKDISSDSATTQIPWTPPDPGLRIQVSKTGMYKLSFAELEDAGVPIGTIDPGKIQIFHLGTEVAFKILPGEGIIFYGEAIESKYTKENVYWLTYGSNLGLRMDSIDGTPTAADVPDSFPVVEHIEEDR